MTEVFCAKTSGWLAPKDSSLRNVAKAKAAVAEMRLSALGFWGADTNVYSVTMNWSPSCPKSGLKILLKTLIITVNN